MALALDAPERHRRVMRPAVTAIVVVHGASADTVDACVRSVLGSTDVDVHIVLVDNASPDKGRACATWEADDRVDVIHSLCNDGLAAGVNQGMRRRRSGDLIWLLNDDAKVAPDCIARCIATLSADPTAVSIAPRVMLTHQPQRVDSVGVVIRPNGEAFNAHIGQHWNDQVADGERIFGACFSAALFRADAFDEAVVGPIDERYRLYYEDIDWALRAQRAGLKTLASVDSIVWHQHAASTRLLGEPARYELVQRNLLLCAAKNLTRRTATAVWAGRTVVHVKGVITGPLRVERVRSLGRALWRLPSVLRARRRLPKGRCVSEDEIFAYSAGMTPIFSTETYRSE
ncbi:MAG: glycosyltransferase family 2 protein [Ilumatobacteraceae bacterium]